MDQFVYLIGNLGTTTEVTKEVVGNLRARALVVAWVVAYESGPVQGSDLELAL